MIDGTVLIEVGGKQLRFRVTNPRSKWRAETIGTKEPGTIEWLDTLGPGDVLIDAGANVGIYSLYAAVIRGCKVYAFEPEALNYARLNDNIFLNEAHNVRAYCVALAAQGGFGALFLSERDLGAACHSLNAEIGPFMETRPAAFAQGATHARLDTFCLTQGIRPTHVKIDVDGLEHEVVTGMGDLPSVRSVQIETNLAIPAHGEMVRVMEGMGFKYDPEQVNRSTRREGPFAGVAEYVWTR